MVIARRELNRAAKRAEAKGDAGASGNGAAKPAPEKTPA